MILVAVDDSESAVHAASYAAGLARRNGSHLLLVHVCRPYLSPTWPEIFGMPWETYAGEEATSSSAPPTSTSDVEILDRLAKTLRDQYLVSAERVVREGVPAREIARLAVERHADVVVVGSSHSLLHHIAGAVSNRLVRRGACTVTVVP